MDSCDGVGGGEICFEQRVVGILHLVLELAGIAFDSEIPLRLLLFGISYRGSFCFGLKKTTKRYQEERGASV